MSQILNFSYAKPFLHIYSLFHRTKILTFKLEIENFTYILHITIFNHPDSSNFHREKRFFTDSISGMRVSKKEEKRGYKVRWLG